MRFASSTTSIIYHPFVVKKKKKAMESKFHETYTVEQEDEIHKKFNERGYVAIRNVLTPAECTETLKEMNQQMQAMNPKFNLWDATTFGEAPILNNFGMYAKQPIFSTQFVKNRENENVYKAFSILYNDGNLLMNHD